MLGQRIDIAATYIKAHCEYKPTVGIVLGSGLGEFANQLADSKTIPYADIPSFPISTVQGHAAQWVTGHMGNQTAVCMQGRFHYYEGYDQEEVTIPIRVMKRLGVEILIVTNSSGGINKTFAPGDLMLITDHINLSGQNPLRGANLDSFGPRFPDMTMAYDRELQQKMLMAAQSKGITLQQGVYAMMAGPSFETPAEIRMLRTMGADAVGMSTVPEVIVARHCGMRIVGVSCVTNPAAGILDQPLTHQEVLENADKAKQKFLDCLTAFVMAL